MFQYFGSSSSHGKAFVDANQYLTISKCKVIVIAEGAAMVWKASYSLIAIALSVVPAQAMEKKTVEGVMVMAIYDRECEPLPPLAKAVVEAALKEMTPEETTIAQEYSIDLMKEFERQPPEYLDGWCVWLKAIVAQMAPARPPAGLDEPKLSPASEQDFVIANFRPPRLNSETDHIMDIFPERFPTKEACNAARFSEKYQIVQHQTRCITTQAACDYARRHVKPYPVLRRDQTICTSDFKATPRPN
jgi:hypothetical protein